MQTYDLLVVGGGFAGTAAAIAAARQGLKVRLIEKYNCLGGAAAYDLVNPFMPYATRDENKKVEKVLSAGIFKEVTDTLWELRGEPKQLTFVFDDEHLKLVLNRLALQAGVELLFGTTVAGVKREGNKIISLTVTNISGTYEMAADYYIDATGDGNLAAFAGFPYQLGRPKDNLCQPMTLCFRMGGVDPEKFAEQRPLINPLYKQMKAEGKIQNPREDVLIFHTLTPDILHFNTTRVVKLNPTDAEEVTKAEVMAREQIFEVTNFLKEHFSAFQNARVIASGMQIGARESRMICGEYTLTAEDITSFKKFPDGIAACNYDLDIHSPDGSGTSHWYFPPKTYYTIPYRCLLPKESENLLVAGRCVSATHEAQASLRIMPVVCTLGEAAGVAAALAKKKECGVREINTAELRDILRNQGAVVD